MYIDDNNIHQLDLNENNFQNNLMRYSGRIVFKDSINTHEFPNNMINGNKSLNSSKNMNSYFKNGFRGVKMKKESYFNTSNKITINAKNNEINKSNK